MGFNFYKYPKIVLLPIQDPWATMIANKEKKLELRMWKPSFPEGSLLLIVATGKTKGPRKIIASAVYSGFYSAKNLKEWSLVPKNSKYLRKVGWMDQGENAMVLQDIVKWPTPLPITHIPTVKRTPMKFQYIEPEYLDGKYEE